MPRITPNFFPVFPGDPITSTLWNDTVVAENNWLSNKPAFKGLCSTGPTIATGTTWTHVPLDTTLLDTDSGHSATVNNTRYTSQVVGWYWVTGLISYATAGSAGRMDAAIAVNGTIIVGSATFLARPATQAQRNLTSALLIMQVGDYVELWTRQVTGANATLDNGTGGTGEPSLCLYWLGI